MSTNTEETKEQFESIYKDKLECLVCGYPQISKKIAVTLLRKNVSENNMTIIKY